VPDPQTDPEVDAALEHRHRMLRPVPRSEDAFDGQAGTLDCKAKGNGLNGAEAIGATWALTELALLNANVAIAKANKKARVVMTRLDKGLPLFWVATSKPP